MATTEGRELIFIYLDGKLLFDKRFHKHKDMFEHFGLLKEDYKHTSHSYVLSTYENIVIGTIVDKELYLVTKGLKKDLILSTLEAVKDYTIDHVIYSYTQMDGKPGNDSDDIYMDYDVFVQWCNNEITRNGNKAINFKEDT